MQKKAARRGQRALAFLLCLLMVATLLPVMGASAAEGDVQPADTVKATEGLNMSKQLRLTSDGTYTITLEAYATGESQTVTKKSGVPLDIVLVIDQSGSMAWNDNGGKTNNENDRRMTKLKTAVTSFVASISANAKEFNVEHKIAMVGYASDRYEGQSDGIPGIGYNGSGTYWVNTGLYVNGSFKNYAGNSNTSSLTAQDYQDALVSVNDTTGSVTSSITTAIDSFKASGGTYTEYGLTMAQNVFAHNPTRAYKKEDGTEGQSQRIVVLFTDGETDSNIDDVLSSANTLKGNTYGAYGAKIYCVGFGSSVNTDFLSHVSSNYTTSRYWWGYYGTQVDTKYSMTANNKTELENIFSNFSKDMTESSSSTELTDAAVLKDIISENFDVTKAEASAESYKVTTTDGSTYTTGSKVDDYTATFEKATKTVSVTGFNYKEKYVAAGHAGEKLVVTITGLLPNQSGKKLYSNNNEKSGIYTNSDAEDPFAPFDKPYTSVDTENRVVDFGMTVNIGDSVLNTNAATNQYGTFALNNDTYYTYKLKPVKNSNGNYTFGFTGVDSSLYFADARWTKVNVIPANNVYYDDTFLSGGDTGISSFNDGKYGYDANVDAATAAGSFKPEGSTTALEAKTNFSFTGSRIDLYCTTTNDSNAVVAALWKAEDFGTDGKQPVASKYMINTYESGTLYNVPTLSFDAGEVGDYVLVLYATESSNYRLDGVRVYQPGDDDAKNLYDADEKNATFTKVRDLLLEANSFNGGDASVNGVVYTDQLRKDSHNTTVIDTYEKVGPKNEVYLAKDNAIAFKVDGYQDGKTVMVGLSAPEATASGTVQVTNNTSKKDLTINSNVDMYYEVNPTADGCVVIQNTTDALISVTNVKLSGAAAVDATALSVDEGLLTYMASFDTLEVTEPAPVEPEPTPETPANNTVSAIIHAIWAQVKTSIDRLFGRL
ncbi:MAG: vWA domain-containing protein [Oscillospiraceae bacterium]